MRNVWREEIGNRKVSSEICSHTYSVMIKVLFFCKLVLLSSIFMLHLSKYWIRKKLRERDEKQSQENEAQKKKKKSIKCENNNVKCCMICGWYVIRIRCCILWYRIQPVLCLYISISILNVFCHSQCHSISREIQVNCVPHMYIKSLGKKIVFY